jgi:hypothetical protein
MSRNLIPLSHCPIKFGSTGLETTQAGGVGQPKVRGYAHCSVAVPTPEKPGDITVGPPPPKKPTSVQKSYPLSMIRKVLRNNHSGGSVVDLQLLRSIRWPA